MNLPTRGKQLGWGILAPLLMMSCHGHDHGHEGHAHGEQSTKGHHHGDEHPEGHDHHQPDRGHGDTPMVGTTLWSHTFELFSEHPPGVVGEPVKFLIHLTRLPSFQALESGTVKMVFDGPAPLGGKTERALQRGIFEVSVTPQKSGVYQGTVVVEGDYPGKVAGVVLEVFADKETAYASVPKEEESGHVQFLKEQQWGVPFGTATVESRLVLPSVVVTGTITTPPGGQALVGAPVTGRVVSPPGGLPRPGADVKQGQLLALLNPAPSSPEAVARARLSVAKAQARVDAAALSLDRAQRLIRDEAISKRELEEARRENTVALEALAAAQTSDALYSGARDARRQASWRLTSPITGTLVEVAAMPGATASPGETLFRVVDTRELWLSARIPEQDLPRLEAQRDASFKVAGTDSWLPLRLGGNMPSASLVTVGRTVDPTSRTVDVIYALAEKDRLLRVGATVHVSVPVGQATEGVAVERSALLDQDGRAVVYVQVDGEHFEERAVRVGARAGDWVSVTAGLAIGERVVTRGTHLVRLAARSSENTVHGHGHVH